MGLRLVRTILFLLLLHAWSLHAAAGQDLMVAVAANYAPAMERIISLFTRETGIQTRMTVSSTGRLYAQIKNKAPFDLFYSADSRRAELLYAGGECAEPLRYATGEVVLWSANKRYCSYGTWQDVVMDNAVHNIAIANPEIAPYGTVARKVLEEANLDKVEAKLIYSANAGQSFQYAVLGAVDAAFIARSHALSDNGGNGCAWRVPEAQKIEQKACVISYGRNVKNARRFLDFTLSDKIDAIRRKFGYGK